MKGKILGRKRLGEIGTLSTPRFRGVAISHGFPYHIGVQIGFDGTACRLVWSRIMRSLFELKAAELIGCGLPQDQAEAFVAAIGELDQTMTPSQAWQWLTGNLLRPEHPLAVHEHLHGVIFADWDSDNGPAPAWFPEDPESSNIAWLMRKVGKENYRDLHAWSVSQPQEFWATMVERLDVQFCQTFLHALDLADGPEYPRWLVGSKLNVVDSCFQASDDSVAVIYGSEDVTTRCMSVAELRSLVARVANGLRDFGAKTGDRVAMDMPMTVESVAIYLGAVAIGCPVVTVADSFAPAEIEVRLRIGKPRCIFTQDFALRRGKRLPLYEKVRAAARRRRSLCRAARKSTASCARGTWRGGISFPTGQIFRPCRAIQPMSARSCSPRALPARPRPSRGTRPRRSRPPSMRTCIRISIQAMSSAGRPTWAG